MDGVTTIIEASKEFKVLQKNELGEEAAMGSPALSDGQLFLRSLGHLYCIGARRES
jgi:hypothetical protein